MVDSKKKSIFIICLSFLLCFVLFIYANGDITSFYSSDEIVVNMNLLPMKEYEYLNSEEEIKDIPDFTFTNTNIVLDENCKIVEGGEKLFQKVDLATFKPSYNILVTYALSEIDSNYNKFSNSLDSWSLDFLNWCILKAGLGNSIPITESIEELSEYYKDSNSFYSNTTACYPLIGDIILIDFDFDNIAESVNIVSQVDNGKISTVGGAIWSEIEKEYIVQELEYLFTDNRIVGVCRPNYGLNEKMENFSDFDLPFNGVDTIIYLKEDNYAYNLADKGIKVIARYINPEGRYPLDLSEVQRFSNAGVRVMMIYQVNKDDPYKGYEKGKEIGQKALIYARNLQAPKGMPIFFCCDCANRFESFDKVAQFLIGVKEVMQEEYSVGLYGGYYVNEAMYNLGLIDAYWQCWGFSDGYLSKNADMVQYTTGRRFFDDIPYYYDANYVKNIEKISFILEQVN